MRTPEDCGIIIISIRWHDAGGQWDHATPSWAGQQFLAPTDDCCCKQDVGRLAKHFKDPKFCEMFAEYARELADPKVGLCVPSAA